MVGNNGEPVEPSDLRSHLSLKLQNGEPMYYSYILLSSRSHIFYFGSTSNLKKRLELHNSGRVSATKPHRPWTIIWFGSFETKKEASDFEQYLKSGSGKAFAYKRLVSVALAKDISARRSKRYSEA